MEPIPAPAAPKIPAAQREAEQMVLGYLQQTVDALPAGTRLDGTRYRIGTGTTYCDDDPANTDAPVHFSDWRDVVPPAGADVAAIVADAGEVWKRWGWQVVERDGFDKPNRFGYAPDGYRLQIESRPGYPPSLIGASPCFPGSLRSNDFALPVVIVQTPKR